MTKFILIDGHAIFYRAFHAIPLLKNSKNEFTNAVFGFTRILFDLIKKEKPDYLAIAFDHKEKTLRAQEFAEYKANRPPPPDELFPQLPRLQHLLKELNFQMFELQGYEADDLIGTIARKAIEKDSGLEVIICTGDQDALQLVNDRVFVLSPQMGFSKATLYDRKKIEEKYGLSPRQIIDYKALRGDTSDNIPGVKGIGEKQATELLQKYKTLDGIYENVEQLSGAQKQKLIDNKEMAYFSQKLATIDVDSPIEFDFEKCRLIPVSKSKAKALLEENEFKSLLRYLDDLESLFETQDENQASMF